MQRRTFLRGVLAGGAAVCVGLPVLDVWLNESGTALAAGGALPRRFGLFYWGNGMLPDRWVPQGSGTDWTLSDQLAPLESVKEQISVISGMSVKVPGIEPHY